MKWRRIYISKHDMSSISLTINSSKSSEKCRLTSASDRDSAAAQQARRPAGVSNSIGEDVLTCEAVVAILVSGRTCRRMAPVVNVALEES